MGSVARPPDEFAGPNEERSDEESKHEKLGDALSGLLADVDVDSVDAVRRIREDE